MSTSPGATQISKETTPSPPPSPKGHKGAWIATIVVIIVILAAALSYYYLVYLPGTRSPAPLLQEGGFTQGSVVTFVYNGTDTFLCEPSMTVMFPNDPTASAAAAKTECEVGNASQNAVPQVPEWVLVPAYAGLSIFGVGALGATARGFPAVNGTGLLTDCGAGGTPTACVDHPTYLYSPLFAAVEDHLNLTGGYGGLPLGVLPTPAHDHLLDTPTTYPNVEWGTIAVLVLDPNILPDRATGICAATVPSNLSSPTGNCLTSLNALKAAMTTCSSAAANFNAAAKNPIWQTLVSVGVSPCAQVLVPGVASIAQISSLNSNLYIPFLVQPGAPASFPS